MGTNRRLFRAFLVALSVGSALPSVQGQDLPPKVTTFTPDDYEAHDQIFCAEPLPDGRTAFGTASELLVQDGETFRHVAVGSGKYVFAMDRDSMGRLFIGGNSTMGILLPDSSGSLVHRSLLPLLPDSLRDFGTIWDVIACGEQGVYFAAYDHLIRYHDDTLEVLHPRQRFFRMHIPGSRPVIQDVDTGLFRIRGSERVRLPRSRKLVRKGVMAILSTPGDAGTWTVFTQEQGLFSYDPEQGTVDQLPGEPDGGWSAAEIYTACRLEPDQNPFGAAFAVGTNLKGLYLVSTKGEVLRHLGREEGFPAKKIWQLTSTRGGDIWAMTNNGLALVHTGLPFTVVEEGGVFSGGVNSITRPPPPESPLFLTTDQGVWSWRQDKGTFERFPGTVEQCRNILYLPEVSVDLPGKEGRMLVGGSGAGLLSLPRRIGEGRRTDTVLSSQVRALSSLPLPEGEQPGILAGGRGGFFALSGRFIWKGGPPDTLLSVENVPEDIYSVGVGNKGGDSLRLWAGYPSKGVMAVTVDSAFSGHRIARYDTTDGLPRGQVMVFRGPGRTGGGVVFGTDSGLFRFDGEAFIPDERFGEVFCDGSRQVFRFEKGLSGEVWINDSKGGDIKHLRPEGKGYRIDSTVFRGLDLGTIRAIHPEEVRTWLGGDQGLACYYPGVEQDHGRAWDCLVRKVLGAGDSLLFGGNYRKKGKGRSQKGKGKKQDSLASFLSHVPVEEQLERMVPELPYSENRMAFHFAAPFTDRQEAVEYSYKLAGFDTAWSKWSDQTRKEYTSLPEGGYTFKVKARNVYHNESSTDEYRFRILPPWYRTWEAYGGYTLAGIGFIWLIVWLNGRRLVAQKQRLERIVEERTQEIREQKEKVEEQKQEVERAHEALEESHSEITASIDYAQKIQNALLQTEEYASDHLPEHFILFKPQATVSGDFYWAKEREGHLYLAAVDCTGHGVPGAFMSMLGINQLNEIMAAKDLPTPGEILTDLRERVVAELRSGDPEGGAKDGMDAAMVRIPLKGGDSTGEGRTVQFAGANNPLYVVKEIAAEAIPEVAFYRRDQVIEAGEGSVRPFKKTPEGFEVKGDKMAVGYEPEAAEAFTTAELEVPGNAMLYMFSDGYADQFGGPKGKKFRYGPFKELLARIHTMSPVEQKKELDRVFEEWKKEQEQVDDVCVVGVRV